MSYILNTKLREIILQDVLEELFPNCFKMCNMFVMKDSEKKLPYKQLMEMEKIDR